MKNKWLKSDRDYDYYSTLHALHSCAIEGNEMAIKLLILKDKNHDAFLRELERRGWLKTPAIVGEPSYCVRLDKGQDEDTEND